MPTAIFLNFTVIPFERRGGSRAVCARIRPSSERPTDPPAATAAGRNAARAARIPCRHLRPLRRLTVLVSGNCDRSQNGCDVMPRTPPASSPPRGNRVSGASAAAAVLARTTSSGTSSTTGAGGSDPSMSASRMSIAIPPSWAKSCRTVVSGGMKCLASGMSSNPTTLRSSRHREPEVVGGVDDAQRHLVVRGEDGRELPVAEQLHARARTPGRRSSRRAPGPRSACRCPTSRRGSRASAPRPRSSPAGRRCAGCGCARGRSGAGWRRARPPAGRRPRRARSDRRATAGSRTAPRWRPV